MSARPPVSLGTRLARSPAIFRAFVARVLSSRDRKTRERLFDALTASGADFVYAQLGAERYLVRAGDAVIGREVFLSGQFELSKLERAFALLREHARIAAVDLLVDIGANIGTVCIPAVARGLAARAMAVEPDPGNCRLLRINALLNSVESRIDVHEAALGDGSNTTLLLEQSADNLGDHRIAVSGADGAFGEASRQRIAVRSCRLDELVEPQGATLIWIDIQGYEGFALEGGAALLRASPPIVAEFWPYGMARAGSFAAFREAVAGYRGFVVLDDPSGVVRPVADLAHLHDSVGARPEASVDILIF